MIYSTKLLRALRAEIGRNLHAARVRRKLVLGKLARLSGVAEDKIDRYELGKNEIRIEELLRLACVLDVEPDALMRGAACPSPKNASRFSTLPQGEGGGVELPAGFG